ncbi:hypothetical protein MQX03_09170 [Chryseobacterium aahli]|uniref:hypothetical protein n=1 Tax=Chryseobacterium aahli TaxID=1278643 RepID=UPI001F619ECF|nr:hypothetical protein [Chryseobacterium aahli]MCI3937371.1 hypothetical protein [Chryseobacterium aahli]
MPIGNLALIRKFDGDKYEHFSTEEGAIGNITITKINGKYIEGTFEGEVIPAVSGNESSFKNYGRQVQSNL